LKKIALLLCLSLIFLSPSLVSGQDIHYTQFYHSPLNLNPGLTGIFDGDHRISGHFRRQWKNVPVDYLTFTGSYDTKLYTKKGGNNFFGGGIHINYDRSGFSKLQLAQIGLSGSYSWVVTPSFVITPGVQLAFSQRAFREADLSFDSQFDLARDRFDPSLPTGENFDQLSINFANLGGGVNFRLQRNNRSLVDFGFGAFHLNRPSQQFFSTLDYRLPSRLSAYFSGSLQIADPLDLVLRGAGQWQGEYQEYLGGAGIRFYLNSQRGKQLNLLFGINARINQFTDAVSPTIEVELNTMKVAASYDLNVSPFNVVSEYRGGPEIAVIYRIVKVKPLKVYKTCPIY